jgi:hypothetical protein
MEVDLRAGSSLIFIEGNVIRPCILCRSNRLWASSFFEATIHIVESVDED